MVIIDKLSKSFGSHLVLDEVSLRVEEAENLVVFGRSGTGKSVLLKCMVRLMQPDGGSVSIFGKDVLGLGIDELNELRQQMGFLFQGAALYDSMSVRGNLEFPLIRHSNLTPKEREARIKNVLEKVSLEEAINKMPADLSGGMKKRIGLARAIITEPKLMLYDEPTTGLDPITAKEISKLILDLQKELKMTSVIVTHDILCAKIIADRAVVLEDGKIEYTGDITELTTSKDPFLKNFFSDELIEETGEEMMLKDLTGAKLGIFIFIGSTLLVIGIFLLGNKESLFRPTFTVKAYFSNIEGLRNGAPVRLGGIDVGSVKDIKIVQDTTGRIEVSMRLHNEIQRFIRKDTKASIETEGLVGNKVVVLQIGSATADPIGEGGVIQAKNPVGFGAVIDETQGIMGYTKEMTKNMAEIVEKINKGEGTIGKILTDEKLYFQATELTKRADQSLSAIITELEKVSEIFKSLGGGVNEVITNVNRVVTEVDTIIYGVSKGRGMLGQVLVEGSRYDSLFTSTMSEIQKTSVDARIAASRLSENMEALKHNWLFKSYFEERGYWDKAEYEDEINSSLRELDEKIKLIDQKIETLKTLEEKTSVNK